MITRHNESQYNADIIAHFGLLWGKNCYSAPRFISTVFSVRIIGPGLHELIDFGWV